MRVPNKTVTTSRIPTVATHAKLERHKNIPTDATRVRAQERNIKAPARTDSHRCTGPELRLTNIARESSLSEGSERVVEHGEFFFGRSLADLKKTRSGNELWLLGYQ